MLPRWHILSGFILSFSLCYFFSFSLFAGLIVFLSSIFIDLDYVLVYYLEKKDLHPKNFFYWWNKKHEVWKSLQKEERKNFKSPQRILHGVEFLIILLIFSKINVFFWWIFLGVILHLIFDLIDFGLGEDKHLICSKTSQLWTFHKNKGKRSFVISS
ncbi:Uncharacterised protein [uncultured archaeon]|nr:Uncharacterised protein [uncultured archaeon]